METTKKNKTEKTEEKKLVGPKNKRKNHIGVNVLCIISINEGKM